MRRRKLLISIGALGAGGTAAFGTEAFTSVEAERSVDVTVAGDESAFLAIQPLSGNNADEYVSTEDDDTVALDLDDGAGTDGSGVNQDAVTQVEDLFKIINQGTQPTSVFFEDDSDAVTFRVTQSTDTSTKGPSGESLEGADNSVELETGEQVAVGITVDTLNNDVSGSLVDDVTIRAEAGASAPEQNIPEPQYVVSDSPSGSNEFGDVQSAVDEAEAGAVIGIDGSFSPSPGSQINIDVEDVTLTGFNGKPTVDLTGASPSGTSAGAVQVSASGVTLRNFNIDYEADANGIEANNAGLSDITVDGMRVKNTVKASGKPAINLEKVESVTVTNNEVLGAAIGTFFTTGNSNTSTISNNYIDLNPDDNAPESGGPTEGIFAFGSNVSNTDFEIRNNEVINHNIADVAAKEIKVIDNPASVNGESDAAAQIESLLTENSVNSAQVNSDSGTRATPDIVGAGQQFASVNEVLQPSVKDNKDDVGSPAGSGLVALFEDGNYGSASNEIFDSKITHNEDNAVIKGLSKPTITYTGMGKGKEDVTDVEIAGDGTTVQDLDLVFTNVGGVSVGDEAFLDFTGADGTLRSVDVTYDPRSDAGGPTGYVNVSGSGTITFEGCTFSDTTSGGSNRYVSANGLYDSGGTFELLNCEFNDGTRTDANVDNSGTAVYKNNQFKQKPNGANEAITVSGGPSGGELGFVNNQFQYNNGGEEKILMNGFFPKDSHAVPNNINGNTSETAKEKVKDLSADNNNAEVLVRRADPDPNEPDGKTFRVGGDER